MFYFTIFLRSIGTLLKSLKSSSPETPENENLEEALTQNHGGPDHETCCWCFSLKPGVYLICLMTLIVDFSQVSYGIDILSKDIEKEGLNVLQEFLIIGLLGVQMIVSILSFWWILKFFCNKNTFWGKEYLINSMVAEIFGRTLDFATLLIWFVEAESYTFWRMLGDATLSLIFAILYLYFLSVCKKFQP